MPTGMAEAIATLNAEAGAATAAAAAAAAAATASLVKPPSLPMVSIAPTMPSPVMPSPCRIYVGSIYWDVSEEDIKSVFSAFGTIKSCILMVRLLPPSHCHLFFLRMCGDLLTSDD